MTFAAVGSLLQASATTFSLTPAGVGNLILIEVLNLDSNTIPAASLSSSNVTWSPLGSSFGGTNNTLAAQVFAGKVTSTSTATVTISWSGTTPTDIRAAGQEFSSTLGGWVLDAQGHIDDPSGLTTWASLTPAGAGELYFGYAFNGGSGVAGSTTGYTYGNDAHGNGMAYNPACTSSAQAPVWGDSGQRFGIMVLVREVAPIQLVQSVDIGSNWFGSLAANGTPGNTLFLFAAAFQVTSPSSSAPLYNGAPVPGAVQLWSRASTSGSNDMYSTCWMLPNLPSAGTSISLTVTGGSQPAGDGALVAAEFSGLGPSPAVDRAAVTNAAGSGNASMGATGNIAFVPELILAHAAIFGSFPSTGPGAPWNNISVATPHGIVSWQVAASGSYTWTETGNGSPWAGGIVTVYAPPISLMPMQLPPIFQQRIR